MQKTFVSLPCVYRVFLHSGGRSTIPLVLHPLVSLHARGMRNPDAG